MLDCTVLYWHALSEKGVSLSFIVEESCFDLHWAHMFPSSTACKTHIVWHNCTLASSCQVCWVTRNPLISSPLVFRFSTPFEAERAASECLTFLGSGLDSHVMLSCTQLTAALARSLDLQIDSSGALTRGQGAGQGVTSSPFPTSRHTESQSRQERKPEGGLDLTWVWSVLCTHVSFIHFPVHCRVMCSTLWTV
jgi:hypothetical protein